MDLRALQKPLKERYRGEPGSSRITLTARGSETGAPIACSVDIGRAVYEAQAHAGDLDLAGTLGVSREVPVGFESIRLRFEVEAPEATPDQLRALKEKTEQYCVVMQTLTRPPAIETDWT